MSLAVLLVVSGCVADASRLVGGKMEAVEGPSTDGGKMRDAVGDRTVDAAQSDADAGATVDASDETTDGADGNLDDGTQQADAAADVQEDATDSSSSDAPSDATDAPAQPITVDDSVSGSAVNQFHYVGTHWQHCTFCSIGGTYYHQSISWNNVAGEYVTFTFVGTQLEFYGVHDPRHGIGAASVDGSNDTNLDFYGPFTYGNQLMWTSPVLPYGTHVFTLRVLGMRNAASADTFVVPDRVDIL